MKPIIYELGSDFFDPVEAASFPKQILRFRNHLAANEIQLDKLTEDEWKSHFCFFKPLPNNISQPLALRYHGHQFQHYNPDLGDGRGFLFAQLQGRNSKIYDLGTKGSGQTPYSRAGDGRLTLKGSIREALATELLESLGVNTSKTFSIFETGEALQRNDEPSPTRSAVLVRMCNSHLRIGSFQRLLYFQQKENLQKLAEYSVRNYFPEVSLSDIQWPEKFLKSVIRRNAKLIAEVMMAGFVHGVLNTDNINITGELFDYGPYRFLPVYDPNFTAAYFDQSGLYCFGRQPAIFLWNLTRFAECLQFAFPELNTTLALDEFSSEFNRYVCSQFIHRLGLSEKGTPHDQELLSLFFNFLDVNQPSYEQSFFDFFGGSARSQWLRSPQKSLYQGSEFEKFHEQLLSYTVRRPELLKHPYFSGSRPETLIIDEIEAIWKSIDKSDDWDLFNKKIEAIRSFRGIY